ncbi:hypothetical protein B296_00035948 [Ensete ventricosum]|uniref:Uncharacterized protein n=1 Tax=Ensete ventricosum TaxID=4639 RepID=A0A426ZBX5_ENSVE|nr:hypothetical protein B296_00035948 [Ensete ventricosum]
MGASTILVTLSCLPRWTPLFSFESITGDFYPQHLVLPSISSPGHGALEVSSTAPMATGSHPSAIAHMKEVWVSKLDLEGALAKDGEAEDLPLTKED